MYLNNEKNLRLLLRKIRQKIDEYENQGKYEKCKRVMDRAKYLLSNKIAIQSFTETVYFKDGYTNIAKINQWQEKIPCKSFKEWQEKNGNNTETEKSIF